MEVRDEDVEKVTQRIRELVIDIGASKLTSSDSNVLSVAMDKLLRDVNDIEILLQVREVNKYDDMVQYYDSEVSEKYNRLVTNCDIVCELYSIATDKERKSLLMHLE